MKPMPTPELPDRQVREAAAWIRSVDALVIAAGAGMGLDFRGNDGFWQACPPLRHLGLKFTDLANPAWFEADPPLAVCGCPLDPHQRARIPRSGHANRPAPRRLGGADRPASGNVMPIRPL